MHRFDAVRSTILATVKNVTCGPIPHNSVFYAYPLG